MAFIPHESSTMKLSYEERILLAIHARKESARTLSMRKAPRQHEVLMQYGINILLHEAECLDLLGLLCLIIVVCPATGCPVPQSVRIPGEPFYSKPGVWRNVDIWVSGNSDSTRRRSTLGCLEHDIAK